MNYIIEYAVYCHKGHVRDKNQDNFWCVGTFLEATNEGILSPIIGKVKLKDRPTFAVFDGMGGEQQGEQAAYIAAKTFDNFQKHNPSMGNLLIQSCDVMNKAICDFTYTQPFGSTGTTAAILAFDKCGVSACNIGDSRIYRLSNGILSQISCDHIDSSIKGRKPPLAQNLGIPVTDFQIEPHIASCCYYAGDKYIICSDGLTDMLSDNEIGNILASYRNVAHCGQLLMQSALNAGGHDNITIILCEVKKQNSILNLFKVG